jgi:uncharacterized protein
LIRFLLVANLARLAKWLRFLGYDAALREELGFDAMTTLAARQRRILLTRSKRQETDPRKFARRRIRSDGHVEQLRELGDLLVIDEEKLFTRCGECNRKLTRVSPERAKVPVNVRETQSEVMLCRKCGRVYWRGNHWREIQDVLRSALDGSTGCEAPQAAPESSGSRGSDSPTGS